MRTVGKEMIGSQIRGPIYGDEGRSMASATLENTGRVRGMNIFEWWTKNESGMAPLEKTFEENRCTQIVLKWTPK